MQNTLNITVKDVKISLYQFFINKEKCSSLHKQQNTEILISFIKIV